MGGILNQKLGRLTLGAGYDNIKNNLTGIEKKPTLVKWNI